MALLGADAAKDRLRAKGPIARRSVFFPPAVVSVPAAIVAAALLLPLIYLILKTLGAGAETMELLVRISTLKILLRTCLLALAVTGGSIALAVPLAWLTVRTDLPLKGVLSVLTVLPLVIPSYVGGYVVVTALGPRGMLQQMLAGPFGIERLPEIYGFPGAFLTLTFLSYPYVLLSTRAALWGLDPVLEDASRSLGQGAWTTFRRVLFPQLRPAIAAGGLLVGLYTLSDFGAVSLLRFDTFTRVIYTQYQTSFDRTQAAALSMVLVALALLILSIEAVTRGSAKYYQSTSGSARPAIRVKLGAWRWPTLCCCGLLVLASVVMPLSVLGYWFVRGIAVGEPARLVWGPMMNSLYVSGLAALVATAAALPVVILSVRYPGFLTGLLERISYLGFAVPGIVVALALVFFGANFATPVYQSLVLLIFAYVLLFLPTALGVLRASLLQVSPGVEEVARSLGQRPHQVLATITLPLMRPGLLAGIALVFLVTMKELPATLILGPIGFKTLATSIWSAADEAFFARAAAPALLLILITSIPAIFLTRRERGLER
ncbi:MAG: iron ABC transporter permease [Chloroflexi bacterium]|nr:iron ABC transporter permease [Chloroflexota bacterium]